MAVSRQVVVHDSVGDRVACGVLREAQTPSLAPSPVPSAGPFVTNFPTAPLFAVMGPYPGYSASLVIDAASIRVSTRPVPAPRVILVRPLTATHALRQVSAADAALLLSPTPRPSLTPEEHSHHHGEDEPSTAGLEAPQSSGVVGMMSSVLLLGAVVSVFVARAVVVHKRRPLWSTAGRRPRLPVTTVRKSRLVPGLQQRRSRVRSLCNNAAHGVCWWRVQGPLVVATAVSYITTIAFVLAMFAAQRKSMLGTTESAYDPTSSDVGTLDGGNAAPSDEPSPAEQRKTNAFFLAALLAVVLVRAVANAGGTA